MGLQRVLGLLFWLLALFLRVVKSIIRRIGKRGSRHTTLQEQLLFLVAEVEIQANARCNEQCSSFWCEYLMDREINTNEI